MSISITTDGQRVYLSSPYNADLSPRAKELGGRWDVASKRWHFDGRDEQKVRDLARSIYGTDGSPDEAADVVTVRVHLADYEGSRRDDARRAIFAGRTIAERRYRDSAVQLSAGVVLVAGQLYGSGGSGQYPAIEAADDVIVEIRDIPRASLATVPADSYVIVEQQLDAEALRAERERLAARIAEIDALLAQR